MITNRQLIEALKQLPLDAEIELDVSGYDADGVSLSVGDTTVLNHEFGLNDLHFVPPAAIKGEVEG
jgi:hypothetical protein